MKFISAEEFLKQPKKVQKVFFDYFKLKVGDVAIYLEKPNELCIITQIFNYDDLGGKGTVVISTNEFGGNEIDTFLKVLTEGQLRKFIEDKTGGKVILTYNLLNNILIKVVKGNDIHNNALETICRYPIDRKSNVLNAYWKVACKIC